MKKRIFIGSSSEELGTAKIVQRLLSEEFEVVIWDEKVWDKSVFRLNNNFLTDLISASLKFDFGILIGSPDDKVEFRGQEVLSARSNVIFELGLFIGRLGVEKTAFLVQEEVNIPSDLAGIKLCVFSQKNLVEKVDEIRNHFRNSSTDELNFFPSSTLAAVYYENFVKFVCLNYVRENGFVYKDQKYRNCKFKILVPNSLADNPNIQYQQMQNKVGMDNISFECEGRTRNVHVDVKVVNDQLVLLDFPTLLSGINHAIGQLLPEVHKKQGVEYHMILNRELNRFYDALRSILKRNHYSEFVDFVPMDGYN